MSILLVADKYVTGITDAILDTIDVLVDGPFVESERDITLQFRGSRNQTIWDMKTHEPYGLRKVEWKD